MDYVDNYENEAAASEPPHIVVDESTGEVVETGAAPVEAAPAAENAAAEFFNH